MYKNCTLPFRSSRVQILIFTVHFSIFDQSIPLAATHWFSVVSLFVQMHTHFPTLSFILIIFRDVNINKVRYIFAYME